MKGSGALLLLAPKKGDKGGMMSDDADSKPDDEGGDVEQKKLEAAEDLLDALKAGDAKTVAECISQICQMSVGDY